MEAADGESLRRRRMDGEARRESKGDAGGGGMRAAAAAAAAARLGNAAHGSKSGTFQEWSSSFSTRLPRSISFHSCTGRAPSAPLTSRSRVRASVEPKALMSSSGFILRMSSAFVDGEKPSRLTHGGFCTGVATTTAVDGFLATRAGAGAASGAEDEAAAAVVGAVGGVGAAGGGGGGKAEEASASSEAVGASAVEIGSGATGVGDGAVAGMPPRGVLLRGEKLIEGGMALRRRGRSRLDALQFWGRSRGRGSMKMKPLPFATTGGGVCRRSQFLLPTVYGRSS